MTARLTRAGDHTLSNGDQNVFGSVKPTLAALRRELEEVRGQSVGSGPSRNEKRIMSRISEMLSRQKRSWSGRDQGWTDYGMAIATQPCFRLGHGREPNVTGSVHLGALMEQWRPIRKILSR